MPEPTHQLGEGGAGLGGEDGAGVAEIVPAEVGAAGLRAGRVVDRVERRRSLVGVAVETRLLRRAVSPRRSSASSPKRIAHQAASRHISLYRSGSASTIVSSSWGDAGRPCGLA